MSDTITTEEIARHYSAMGDSVNLINEIIDSGADDQDSLDTIARNKEHLSLMVAKDFWTNEDFDKVNKAINAINA